jgi:CIC family chloride channel protein
MTERQGTGQWLLRLLKFRVWLAEHIRPGERQITLIWAGVIGAVAAFSTLAFRELTDAIHWLMTRHPGGYVETFSHLVWWERLLIPTVGGAMAGLVLKLGSRFIPKRSSTDYMEAVVVGDGVLPVRLSLVKSISAMLSIASGASIGREGPLVQLSAMLSSLIGRFKQAPTMQRRLLVACGAAAGIATAYNAPIGGALFVAEIVLQSLSMETFGPLVFASVVATLTTRQLLNTGPLYHIPAVEMRSSWEILLHCGLGLVAGVCAPAFLKSLRASERWFSALPIAGALRLALGGLIVGALAIVHPEVCGNGYSTVNEILHNEWLWRPLLLVVGMKLLATAASFGSGAVGGVFTPTLFLGASVGSFIGQIADRFFPGLGIQPETYALVGMGALLAGTTHAPLMAIIMIFEMTLDYQIILPLMLACVIAHYTAAAFEPESIYTESLQRKGGGAFRSHLSELRVADLMKPNPAQVTETAHFGQIAQSFLTHRSNYLYVVDSTTHFKGAVALHDIKSYLNQPELAEFVIARDIAREEFLTINPDATLSEALSVFARHDGERLPVIGAEGKLIGTISKTDLILALSEQTKERVG